MSVKIIQERLESYKCLSEFEEELALREITQEVALAALSRTDFFKHAAFQGGTALRIFYSLNRFSEDLDFILKVPYKAFRLEGYLKAVSEELKAYGYAIETSDRSQADDTVKKAFLKDDSIGKVLQLQYLKANRSMRKIRIKLEVDSNPPAGSGSEVKYHDFPFAFASTLQNMPSLFAGKLHALLCRQYTKGRDWYDFVWYIARAVAINFDFLGAALEQTGPWEGRKLNIDLDWCVTALNQKITSVDWTDAKNEIRGFVRKNELPSVELWSTEFFLDRLQAYVARTRLQTL
jgi:predicted nucleotidyltransferase component of viral defense system